MEVFLKYLVVTLSVLSISFTANADSGQFPCGYTYHSEAGAWFKFHPQAAVWNDANDTCALEEHMKLENANDVDVKNADSFVIALASNGQFQPVMPNILLPYICYKKAPQVIPLTKCDPLYPEYTWDNRTNQCYKFHRNRNTWWNAAVTCLDEGANLAVINSEVEAQVIRDIFALNPADVIPGDTWKDVAFLGYLADEERNWYTILGQTFAEAGYENWAPGEPNNARGDEFCGTVGRDAAIYDDPCNRAVPFICEKRTGTCDTSKQHFASTPTQQNTVNINSILLKGRQRKQKNPRIEEDEKNN